MAKAKYVTLRPTRRPSNAIECSRSPVTRALHWLTMLRTACGPTQRSLDALNPRINDPTTFPASEDSVDSGVVDGVFGARGVVYGLSARSPLGEVSIRSSITVLSDERF